MTTPARIIEFVGGRDVVHQAIESQLDLVRLVRRGLPVAAVDHLLEEGLTLSEIDRVVLPRKTLHHRRKLGTLTPEQSDRLLRVARILALATETFGSRDKALRWLRRETTVLEGEAPLNLLDTDEGARQGENLLGRIAHGIAA